MTQKRRVWTDADGILFEVIAEKMSASRPSRPVGVSLEMISISTHDQCSPGGRTDAGGWGRHYCKKIWGKISA